MRKRHRDWGGKTEVKENIKGGWEREEEGDKDGGTIWREREY